MYIWETQRKRRTEELQRTRFVPRRSDVTSPVQFWGRIRYFRVTSSLSFKSMLSVKPENDFNSFGKKTHFQYRGLAQSLVLKVRVVGTRKWPRARFQASFANSASANWPGDEAVRERLQKNFYSQDALCTLTDDEGKAVTTEMLTPFPTEIAPLPAPTPAPPPQLANDTNF